MVSVGSQRLTLWHSGHTVLSTAVNTGIASAPTATGTYPVFEHISSGTMSGTNPDGSHYNDPGIQWISYFNGGDALHAFTRAQFGFPQSLGCVEMQLDPAGRVWPYTPIGTLVHVA
jgi:lipoprotein-anchoring transpeptidase ErfK/SrfK